MNLSYLSSIKTSRDPFEYYSIEFSYLKKKSTWQKITTFSKEFFENAFYYLCNTVIAGANTLKFYKLRKVKITPLPMPTPTKCQTMTFVVQTLMTLNLRIPGISVISKVTDFFYIRETIEKHKFSFVREFFLSTIPVVSLFNQGINTYYVFRRSYTALRECWTLSYKNPSVAARYALIHTSNLFFSIRFLYSKYVDTILYLNIAKSIPYMHELVELEVKTKLNKFSTYDQEKLEIFNSKYEEFLDHLSKEQKCHRSFLNLRLFGKSDEEKINSPILDLNCPDHAKSIISDNWMLNICSDKNLTILKEDYDKKLANIDSNKSDENIQSSLNKAFETIEKECDFNERHKKYFLTKYLKSNLTRLYEFLSKKV